ncbi:TetR family transcriptional regulator [Seongchinamella sediminis]|uniref:TetR family transcriptional regulator n=1 Tax=Seongchinamella sediminis TaxID=2283635 RepID=A0A3L7DX28_9GAMM|nr:TetR/AcrR family transcriptional regulator [Seongchinamella sediminis]RLQ20352.1 TetR family transcriptional regulator [Seongchinamella sediminis]
MNRPKGNAREAILNTAERLFAEKGIQNVSLREINAEAGYSAAALHYHFRSRDALLEALLAMRQQPIMELRATLLQPLQEERLPTVRSLVEALVMPFAYPILTDPEAGMTSVKFFFRAYVEQNHLEQIRKTTERSLQIFEPLLARALPDLDQTTRRTHWLLATELTFQGLANMDAIMELSKPSQPGNNRKHYVQKLISFIAGGLRYGD